MDIPKNLNPINEAPVGAKPQARLKAKNTRLLIWYTCVEDDRVILHEYYDRKKEVALTHVRPYISESGAMKRGPKANERRNIDKVRASTVGLVIPKGHFRTKYKRFYESIRTDHIFPLYLVTQGQSSMFLREPQMYRVKPN